MTRTFYEIIRDILADRHALQSAGRLDAVLLVELDEAEWDIFLRNVYIDIPALMHRGVAGEVKYMGHIVRQKPKPKVAALAARWPVEFKIDRTVPDGEIHARDAQGKLLGKIINIK